MRNWNWPPGTPWWWSATASWTSSHRWRTSPTPSGRPRSPRAPRKRPAAPSWPWLRPTRRRTTSPWSWSAGCPLRTRPHDPFLDPPGGGPHRPDGPELHRLALDVLPELGRVVDRAAAGGRGNLQPHRRHALRDDRVEPEDPQGRPRSAP